MAANIPIEAGAHGRQGGRQPHHRVRQSGQAYRITILNSPNVNAFALPGGYLYVTRGLLALANDSAELAAVVAHEMGHVTANHGLQRQQRKPRKCSPPRW